MMTDFPGACRKCHEKPRQLYSEFCKDCAQPEPKKHVWILTDRDLNDALDLKTDARYGSNDAVMRYLERRRKDAWL